MLYALSYAPTAYRRFRTDMIKDSVQRSVGVGLTPRSCLLFLQRMTHVWAHSAILSLSAVARITDSNRPSARLLRV